VVNIKKEPLLAKIYPNVFASFLHSHNWIKLPLVDISTCDAQEISVPCEKSCIVSEVHTAPYDIICVEFWPICFPSSLAAKYIPIIAVVTP
jgi:hypothetical protein